MSQLTVYRAVWVDALALDALLAGHPILPAGVASAEELSGLLTEGVRNFGSLRDAAIHHLTGSSGVAPNAFGRPLFTFWTRVREVALNRLETSYADSMADVAVLITARIARSAQVVVATEEGIYGERIFGGNSTVTFEDFAPEDEVFIAEPVVSYGIDIVCRKPRT